VRCEECAYDYDSLDRAELTGTLRTLALKYPAVLASASDEKLRAHPLDGIWSVLEYACHMRDVLRVQRQRLALALREDEPTFESMRRDERVIEEGYNDQDPRVVAQQLVDAAGALSDAYDALDEPSWQRTGIASYPSPDIRTVEWLARHTIHELEHHLMDVARLLGSAGER
jgi:DinB family protein